MPTARCRLWPQEGRLSRGDAARPKLTTDRRTAPDIWRFSIIIGKSKRVSLCSETVNAQACRLLSDSFKSWSARQHPGYAPGLPLRRGRFLFAQVISIRGFRYGNVACRYGHVVRHAFGRALWALCRHGRCWTMQRAVHRTPRVSLRASR